MPDPAAYHERAPHPPLRPHASRAWTSVGGAASAPVRVLPDGCVDVVVQPADGPAGGLRVDVVGAMTRPLVVAGAGWAAGLRLRSGHAAAALGVHAAALTDLRLPLAALRPAGELAALHDAVAAAAAGAGGGAAAAAAALDALERALAALPPLAAAPPPPLVRAAVRRLFGGSDRVQPLADALGVSRQQLARQFARHVGVSPKLLGRVARVRRVLRLAARAGDPDWSRLALEAGFCDQPHLVADVRAITGLTPGRWWAARAAPPPVPFLQDAGRAGA